MLDLDQVRAAFPGLDDRWAALDNAGGTLPAQAVRERVIAALGPAMVARGGPHSSSAAAAELYNAGHAAIAAWIGAAADEVVLSGSTTQTLDLLARALRPTWREGDRIIVTDLDHESNIGPWRRLAATGIEVSEWRLRPETQSLALDDLKKLLDDRTRLVAFTHCSNVVGAIVDLPAITDLVHQAGALVAVDGVAYAPHRLLDLAAWDVDFYAISLYKIFGPHLGLLYGKRALLTAGEPPAHPFIARGDLPYRYEPGGASPELVAGLPGIPEHFEALDRETFALRGDADEAPRGRIFDAIAAHEAALTERLLAALQASPRVHLVGPKTADPALRVGLVAFAIAGVPAATVAQTLAAAGIAARAGHFYAPRAVARLAPDPDQGLVRLSLAHYNTTAEIDRALQALEPLLDPSYGGASR